MFMSQRRRQQLSIGGTLSSYSASDINEDSAGIGTFYNQFVKEKLFQRSQIVSTQIRQQEEGKPTKPFTVYIINVRTKDIEYTVERRYSCFRTLFKKLPKKLNLREYFPRKSLFSKGTEESVVARRKDTLTKFLIELQQIQDKADIIEYYEFLDIHKTYTTEKILLPYQVESSRKMDEEVILDMLVELDQHWKDEASITIVAQIEQEIFENRIKASGEVIRQIFLGNSKRKGLLEISLCTDKEYLALKCLQLLNRLLSFEQNRDAEVYARIFAGCQSKYLIPYNKLLASTQVKLNYFMLLDIYFKRNNQLSQDREFGILFGNGMSEQRKQYLYWLKGRDKSSRTVECYKLKSPESPLRKPQMPKCLHQAVEWDSGLELLDINKNKTITVQSNSSDLLKLSFEMQAVNDKTREKLLNAGCWNMQVSDYQRNLYTGVEEYNSSFTPGKCKHFKFAREISQQQGTTTAYRWPPRKLQEDVLSFYQVVRIKQIDPEETGNKKYRVEIWMYLESKESREFWSSELARQTSVLIESASRLV